MARARVVPVAFALLAIALSAQKLATAAPHPHFNDRGTLSWYTSLAEAQSVARETGRLIFIDSGRLECGNCKKLIGSILPQEPIRSRIGAIAIGLSDDCDNPDPAVAAILEANVPGAAVLPIVGFVTPELRWVTGWSGGTTPAAVLQQVTIAEDRYRKVQSVMAARRAPTPQVAPQASPQVPAPQPLVAQPEPLAARSMPQTAPTPAPVAAAPKEVAPMAIPSVPAPAPLASTEVAKAPVRTQAPASNQMPETKPEPLALMSPKAAPAPTVLDNAAPPAIAAAPAKSSSGNRPSISMSGGSATAVPQSVPSTPSAITGVAPLAATSKSNAAITSKSTTAAKAGTQTGTSSVLGRARTAAADQAWGDLVRLGETLPATDNGSDAYEVRMLVQSAYTWTLDSLSTAQTAAAERRYDDALRTLEVVRRELDGTTCPAVRDAERGRRAVERLRDIERGSPDQADAPDADRRVAYAEFRGSRWACLFRKK